MALLDVLIAKAESGKRIKISLEFGNLWIEKRQIIDHGKLIVDSVGGQKIDCLIDNPVTNLDELLPLYESFIHSVPNSENSNRLYCFRPLRVDELTMQDLAEAKPRDIEHIKLCCSIMFSAMTGSLKWDKRGWFYRYPNSNFVMYKNYID